MPEYQTPGVYVEEVPSAVKPIAGVGTSTAGFIGIVADNVPMPVIPGTESDKYTKAPAGQPIRLTGWEQFKKNFGDFHAGNKMLAHAVYGFFNNGGTACWVIRVTDSEADTFQAALDTFKSIDEIAIVAIPGVVDTTVQEKILAHCEGMQDRFAILDGQRLEGESGGYTADAIRGGGDGGTALRYSIDGYGALYFPWIQVFDPASGTNIFVPPSGHLAGIYARSDGERGVHKAPANEVIRGAVDLEHHLNKDDQGVLNVAGIDVIRIFSGNITVWGGRTYADPTTDPEWKYISTRRLFNFLRESIEEGTRWVVFEPNDMSLWQKIRRNVTAFLTNVWRAGALFGATPEQAFYVKCDEETNPPEVRELGQVVTEIGVAIVKPAEFVIFRISQWGGPSA
ncbi:MAG: phage tail sheath family protein [Candidatus Aminicenantes bacterium]|nr:phage tail sheath family protein [Candidatus Aminicenantes bacterium]NIM80172.1 phage tail sheath family protein [Candidatus Aminicenantes bacterium]NIN19508.1 phage tail sheath family protein [Candidatus Aminicenantes bacterium]NIN43407.1 phage tail sheath family protein [Candidatus Aminicenantes bacterium]NIN86152.1 phage tail sheath family protein [Candidatus Aminicenantes bacterium]